MFNALECKLSYEDIRFYRSIARSQLKKDLAVKRKLEEEKKASQAPQTKTWSAWLWGSANSDDADSANTSSAGEADAAFGGTMTDQQRKELYEALDYDEKTALAEAFITDRDALKARIALKLAQGSFVLKQVGALDMPTQIQRNEDKSGPSQGQELISLLFDGFRADLIQRPDNFDVMLSLTDFRVFDGTTRENLYNQIVRVKGSAGSLVGTPDASSAELIAATTANVDTRDEGDGAVEPFLSLKFEQNPLDERADYGVTMYMRSMEIIYHKGYVEAIYEFFKPPESQLQSVEALLVCRFIIEITLFYNEL